MATGGEVGKSNTHVVVVGDPAHELSVQTKKMLSDAGYKVSALHPDSSVLPKDVHAVVGVFPDVKIGSVISAEAINPQEPANPIGHDKIISRLVTLNGGMPIPTAAVVETIGDTSALPTHTFYIPSASLLPTSPSGDRLTFADALFGSASKIAKRPVRAELGPITVLGDDSTEVVNLAQALSRKGFAVAVGGKEVSYISEGREQSIPVPTPIMVNVVGSSVKLTLPGYGKAAAVEKTITVADSAKIPSRVKGAIVDALGEKERVLARIAKTRHLRPFMPAGVNSAPKQIAVN